MMYIGPIFLLAMLVLYGLVSIAMVIIGVRKGKLHYLAGSPPIVYKETPARFVLWVAFLLFMSLVCLGVAAILAAKLMHRG